MLDYVSKFATQSVKVMKRCRKVPPNDGRRRVSVRELGAREGHACEGGSKFGKKKNEEVKKSCRAKAEEEFEFGGEFFCWSIFVERGREREIPKMAKMLSNLAKMTENQS